MFDSDGGRVKFIKQPVERAEGQGWRAVKWVGLRVYGFRFRLKRKEVREVGLRVQDWSHWFRFRFRADGSWFMVWCLGGRV